jgi:hypothetical protein
MEKVRFLYFNQIESRPSDLFYSSSFRLYGCMAYAFYELGSKSRGSCLGGSSINSILSKKGGKASCWWTLHRIPLVIINVDDVSPRYTGTPRPFDISWWFALYPCIFRTSRHVLAYRKLNTLVAFLWYRNEGSGSV